jgi:hypothetical protein
VLRSSARFRPACCVHLLFASDYGRRAQRRYRTHASAVEITWSFVSTLGSRGSASPRPKLRSLAVLCMVAETSLFRLLERGTRGHFDFWWRSLNNGEQCVQDRHRRQVFKAISEIDRWLTSDTEILTQLLLFAICQNLKRPETAGEARTQPLCLRLILSLALKPASPYRTQRRDRVAYQLYRS